MSRKPAETPLYVKLPRAEGDKLDRAAAALGMAKKELVAGLVSRYVDPDSQQGLRTLSTLAVRPLPEPGTPTTTTGMYSFQPYDPPEVMSAEQAARFLQLGEAELVALAEAGQLPGRKLGSAWRFSRAALVGWLAGPDR